MSEAKPCIVLLQGTFQEGGKETPEFKEYSARANANGAAHGAKVLRLYTVNQNLGQGDITNFVVVVEYPSRAIAEDVFTNDEYKSIIPLRQVAFKEVKILISEEFENA